MDVAFKSLSLITALLAFAAVGHVHAGPPHELLADSGATTSFVDQVGLDFTLLFDSSDEVLMLKHAQDRQPDAANVALPTDFKVSLGMLQEVSGGASQGSDLAKAAQNPIADLISLPFQYNLNFNVGPDKDPQHVLNIQPVYPINLNEDWNLITRTIVPVIQQPTLFRGDDDDFGLGDVQFTAFFSPAKSDGLTWGVGPAIRFPTATHRDLGSEQWSLGPSLVALRIDGPWVYGALLQNVWSVAGDDGRADVNELLLQPFVNYNFDDGWYVTTSPIITANWEADSSDRWTVPLGGGVGRVFSIGDQPVNFQVQGFYNLENPDNASDWGIRVQLQLLFPK
ncbi:MAG: neuromedin U [Planctomycetota bacterium]|jgi:hypothetical protein